MKDRPEIDNLRGVYSTSTVSRDAALLGGKAAVIGIVATVDPEAYVEVIETEITPEQEDELKTLAATSTKKEESEKKAEELNINVTGLTKDQIIEKIRTHYEGGETKPREVEAHLITTKGASAELFGKDSEMHKLIDIVTTIGVDRVIAVPVIGTVEEGEIKQGDLDDYKKSLELLYAENIVGIIITDSIDEEFHLEIKSHCNKANKNEKERYSHLGSGVGKTFSKLEDVSDSTLWVELASKLNDGATTLWSNTTLSVDGEAHGHSVYLAAAIAAYDALEVDPAMPIHSLIIKEGIFGGLYNTWEAEQQNYLYGNGVAGAIDINGDIEIDRWVTTYTEDRTVDPAEPCIKYQEGTTKKIENYINKGLREYIRGLYPREKSVPRVVRRVGTDCEMWLKGEEGKEIIEEPILKNVYRDPKHIKDIRVDFDYYIVLPNNRILLNGHGIVR